MMKRPARKREQLHANCRKTEILQRDERLVVTDADGKVIHEEPLFRGR